MNQQQQFHRTSFWTVLLLWAGFIGFVAKHPNLAAATNAPAPVQKMSAIAQIVFRGTSTLHDFSGRVRSEPFELLLSPNRWSARGEVQAGAMTTSHARRDRNMRIMLATDQYPRLFARIVNAVRGATGNAPARLALKIRDQEIDLPVTITDWSETTNAVRFRAFWEVSLKQFGIKPPSVMGLIQVGDKILLDADVTAVPPEAASNLHREKEETIFPR